MQFDISSSEPQAILTLLNLKGIGRISTIRLAQKFETLAEIFSADPTQLKNLVPTNSQAFFHDANSRTSAFSTATKILEAANHEGVNVFTFFSNHYPALLKDIPDFPPVIYVKGSLRTSPRNIACVGTRTPSYFGRVVTERLVDYFVGKNWGIVSGLAIGIDSLAHQTALNKGGYTIAVLAGGLDQIHPKRNIGLARQIVESGGALLSEQPFGTAAIARNLVQRDRLQSGLSVATIPMQTDIKGGTMHTVRFTLEQGRKLYVPIPSGTHVEEPKSQGLLALANNSGPQLAGLLGANPAFTHLLTKNFPNSPVARGIKGRNDYPEILAELESFIRTSDSNSINAIYQQSSFEDL